MVKRDGEEKERKKHKSYVATSRVFFPLRNFIVKKKNYRDEKQSQFLFLKTNSKSTRVVLDESKDGVSFYVKQQDSPGGR